MFIFDTNDIHKALDKVLVTKSAGVDGWKPYYLKSLLNIHYEERIFEKFETIFGFVMIIY